MWFQVLPDYYYQEQEDTEMIFFVQVKGKGGNMTTKAVAGDRVIYTVEKPAYLAKNRYALPESLPFEWETVRAEMLK